VRVEPPSIISEVTGGVIEPVGVHYFRMDNVINVVASGNLTKIIVMVFPVPIKGNTVSTSLTGILVRRLTGVQDAFGCKHLHVATSFQ
jgi:hypothetical protein